MSAYKIYSNVDELFSILVSKMNCKLQSIEDLITLGFSIHSYIKEATIYKKDNLFIVMDNDLNIVSKYLPSIHYHYHTNGQLKKLFKIENNLIIDYDNKGNIEKTSRQKYSNRYKQSYINVIDYEEGKKKELNKLFNKNTNNLFLESTRINYITGKKSYCLKDKEYSEIGLYFLPSFSTCSCVALKLLIFKL